MKKYFILIIILLFSGCQTYPIFAANISGYTPETDPQDESKFYLLKNSSTVPVNRYVTYKTIKDKILDLVTENINWDSIENINTENINWSDFDIPLSNVNWENLQINNSNINWNDLSIPNDSMNWDDIALPFESKIGFENPTATDDFFFDEVIDGNVLLQSIYCKTLVGTVDADVSIGGSAINGANITCTTSGVLDDALGGATSGTNGDELKLEIDSVASSPTFLFLKVKGVYVK